MIRKGHKVVKGRPASPGNDSYRRRFSPGPLASPEKLPDKDKS